MEFQGSSVPSENWQPYLIVFPKNWAIRCLFIGGSQSLSRAPFFSKMGRKDFLGTNFSYHKPATGPVKVAVGSHTRFLLPWMGSLVEDGHRLCNPILMSATVMQMVKGIIIKCNEGWVGAQRIPTPCHLFKGKGRCDLCAVKMCRKELARWTSR